MNKRISTLLVLCACAGSILFSSGCTKKPVMPPDSSSASGSGSDMGSSPYPPADGSEFSQDNLPAVGSLDDSAGGSGAGYYGDNASDEYKRLHGRSSEGLSPVYFDFDQAIIRPDMTERMIKNSEFLKQSPNLRIIVEGNTDERGTNEYNLALAERRAQNARSYLIRLGIDPVRMRTISYGEEKPLFFGQDEDAYSQNRRADFVIE